jgi:hypothetical protein|eukprot:COSAG01_NODE_1306_length_10805_cov_29.835700_9_plen_122_part_00
MDEFVDVSAAEKAFMKMVRPLLVSAAAQHALRAAAAREGRRGLVHSPVPIVSHPEILSARARSGTSSPAAMRGRERCTPTTTSRPSAWSSPHATSRISAKARVVSHSHARTRPRRVWYGCG